MDKKYIDVFNKISEEDRKNWYLYVDAVYRANRNIPNIGSEVLSKLLGVKNQGGFRYLGKTEEPNLVVLFSTGEDIYWKDELDNELGIFLYYGDNNTPGNDLHKTNLHGNEILRYIFSLACSDDISVRKKIPPVLVFKKDAGRDVQFLGLAVPGLTGGLKKNWLTAVWGSNSQGDRFQNYKALFTILDTSSGSKNEVNNAGINLAWITDVVKGQAYDSKYAPLAWKKYISKSKYSPLMAKMEKTVKTKDEQLPDNKITKEILEELQNYFIEKDNGYSFEEFSRYIIECMDNAISNFRVTRHHKDGGIDGVGEYQIFMKHSDKPVFVEFYMQAKCYKMSNGLGVHDTARLISRIKNRQFGILITTSYVDKQAYQELLDDRHPVVIINGRNIADFIVNEIEIRDKKSLITWLDNMFLE